MKTCSKCGVAKPPQDYCQLAAGRDGLYPSCKLCEAKRGQERDARRRHDPTRIEQRRAAQQKYTSTMRGKRTRARGAASAADKLSGWYVRSLLSREASGVSPRDLPEGIVQLKREQLSLLRLTKQLKQEITNQLEKQDGN